MSGVYESDRTGPEVDLVLDNAELMYGLQTFTGLTGGGTALDGKTTIGLGIGSVARVCVTSRAISFYRLRAGTEAEYSPYIIRPDDYNAVSNAVIWELLDNTPANVNVKSWGGQTELLSGLSGVGRISRISNNTAADGFGLTLSFGLKTSTTDDSNAATLNVIWRTAAHATRSAGVEWDLVDQAVSSPAMYLEGLTLVGNRYFGLGIGSRPAAPLHVKADYQFNVTQLLMENANTTDGNGAVCSIRGTTTGVGAATQQEMAGWRGVITTHDHPTRASRFDFFCLNAGSYEVLKWAPGKLLIWGDLSLNQVSLYRVADKIFGIGDGTATATGWFNYAGQKRASAQFDKVNNTLADVTGLTATLIAGRTYRFRAVLFCTLQVTGGIKVGVGTSDTLTATAIRYHVKVINNATSSMVVTSELTTLGSSATTAGTTAAKVEIDGVITVNAAGVFAVQFAQSVTNATPSSVLIGSHLMVEDIP